MITIVNMITVIMANFVTAQSPLEMWHTRFGHINKTTVYNLIKNNLVDGLTASDINRCGNNDIKNEVCEHCTKGKMTKNNFVRGQHIRSRKRLALVHADLITMSNLLTNTGKRYGLLLVDDFSRYIILYLLAHKSETFMKFKTFCEMAKSKEGKQITRVSIFRSDLGTEFDNSDMKEYCIQEGIKKEFSNPDTPQQNSIAERHIRSVVDIGRTILLRSGLARKWWGEAMLTAVKLSNMVTHAALPPNFTPYQLWHGHRPKVSNLRPFGCQAFVHIGKNNRSNKKLAARSVKGVMVGYDQSREAYRILHVSTGKILISRDVKFNEHIYPLYKYTNEPIDSSCITDVSEDDDTGEERMMSDGSNDQTKKRKRDDKSLVTPATESKKRQIILRRYPNRQTKTPDRLGASVATINNNNSMAPPTIPEHLKDVYNSPNRAEWLEAIKSELTSLK